METDHKASRQFAEQNEGTFLAQPETAVLHTRSRAELSESGMIGDGMDRTVDLIKSFPDLSQTEFEKPLPKTMIETLERMRSEDAGDPEPFEEFEVYGDAVVEPEFIERISEANNCSHIEAIDRLRSSQQEQKPAHIQTIYFIETNGEGTEYDFDYPQPQAGP